MKKKTTSNFNELITSMRWVSSCLSVLFAMQVKIIKHLLVGDEHSRLTVDDLKPLLEGQHSAERQLTVIACKHNDDINLLVVKDGMITCKGGCGLEQKISDTDADLIKLAQGKVEEVDETKKNH